MRNGDGDEFKQSLHHEGAKNTKRLALIPQMHEPQYFRLPHNSREPERLNAF